MKREDKKRQGTDNERRTKKRSDRTTDCVSLNKDQLDIKQRRDKEQNTKRLIK